MVVARKKKVFIGDGSYVAPPVDPDVPVGRPTNYGDYLPVRGVNCGLTDASVLTDYNPNNVDTATLHAASTITIANGAQISVKIIYGDIKPPSSHTTDITLNNCRLVGGTHIQTYNDAVVNGTTSRTGGGRIILTDCEIVPQKPALNRDGVRGFRVEVYRTYIRDVIDGFGPYIASTINGGNLENRFMGNIVDEMRYIYPDYSNGTSGATEHTDGTHNDCVHHHGGNDCIYRGNLLRAYAISDPTNVGAPHSTGWYGQGILQAKESAAPVGSSSTVIYDRNWIVGGKNSQTQIQSDTTCTYTGNRHYVDTLNGYWIRIEGTRLVPGLMNADGTINNQGNVWADGVNEGKLLASPRTSGITLDPALSG